jgi:hypothetical protein
LGRIQIEAPAEGHVPVSRFYGEISLIFSEGRSPVVRSAMIAASYRV